MKAGQVAFQIALATDARARCRKTALWNVATRICHLRPGASVRDVAFCLLHRERLGSTGLGRGLAMPHAVVERASPPLILISRLGQAVAFDAPDGSGVDLLVTVVGESEELKRLRTVVSRLAMRAGDPGFLDALRRSEGISQIAELFTSLGIASAVHRPATESLGPREVLNPKALS